MLRIAPPPTRGPSPQVRGRHGRLLAPLGPGRTIPAGAGPTATQQWRDGEARDHPRRCGADRSHAGQARTEDGPSPQVRGRRQGCEQPRPAAWTIPAGAGPTSTDRGYPNRRADHPRRCGADAFAKSAGEYGYGPSPQVRGRPYSGRCPCPAARTIPAGAGPTGEIRCRRGPPADHPRRCGADTNRPDIRRIRRGPSPQVRGRHHPSHLRPAVPWTIPAGARPTTGPIIAGLHAADHPRRCGADFVARSKGSSRGGPSPQVRGRPVTALGFPAAPGTIPAGAGPTS